MFEDDLVEWLSLASHDIQLKLDNLLRPLNLNSRLYFYIQKIAVQPGIKQDDLGKLVKLNQSTITRAVQQLVQKGFLEKKVDDQDKRTSHLFVTELGEQVLPQINKIINDMNIELVAKVSPEFQGDFVKLIRDFAKNIEAK
ncbi:MarR family winged helix-turn-helix transcriptional regulator [Periweissella cryptocerci]|nr:MarR family transcriptional regulator [Periweissella cryptocerci]